MRHAAAFCLLLAVLCATASAQPPKTVRVVPAVTRARPEPPQPILPFSANPPVVLRRTLAGAFRWIGATACLPGGLYAIGSANLETGDPTPGHILLWDALKGELKQEFGSVATGVHAMTFSADEARVVTVSTDDSIALWSRPEGKLVRALVQGQTPLQEFRSSADKRAEAIFLPNAKSLVTLTWTPKNRTQMPVVRLWDAATGSLLRSLNLDDPGSIATLSVDGTRLLASRRDGAMRLWDVVAGTVVHVLEPSSLVVDQVSFSASGRLVLAEGFHYSPPNTAEGKPRGGLTMWDAASGKVLWTEPNNRESFLSRPLVSPDDKVMLSLTSPYLADAQPACVAQVRDLATHQQLWTYKPEGRGVPTDFAFSPDSSLLALGDSPVPHLWEARTGKARTLKRGRFGGPDGGHIAFSPDGQTLSSGTVFWDVATGAVRQQIAAQNQDINAVAFAPDGSTLATGDAIGPGNGSNGVRGEITLWDVKTRQVRRVLAANAGGVSSLAYSPNGAVLASGGEDQQIMVWDTATWQVKRTLTTGGRKVANAVSGLAFAPDGTLLVGANQDGAMRLWDIGDGSVVWTQTPHEATFAVAFAPNGRAIASSGASKIQRNNGDGEVKLWAADAGAGHPLLATADPNVIPLSLAFSPDGKLLAVGFYVVQAGGKAELRDAKTGQVRLSISLPGLHFGTPVGFSSDGKLLATAGPQYQGPYDAATAQLWDVQTGALVNTLKAHMPVAELAATKPLPPAGTLTFSPDRKLLVTAGPQYTSSQGSIALWPLDGVAAQPGQP